MTDDGSTVGHQDRTDRQDRNERMAKDMQEWKERISFSLDQRQIFFLCFGGALSASLIFVLGVMLGKRLEARTHHPSASALADGEALGRSPRLGEEGAAAFEQALPSVPERSSRPGAASTGTSPPQLPTPSPTLPGVTAAKKETTPAAAALPSKAPAESPKALAESTKAPESPKTAADSANAHDGDGRTETNSAATSAQGPTEKAAPVRAGKSRYTLQLSSFQDRAEAEAFVKKFEGTGQKLFIVAADIPGRGVWYRVRLGEFPSEDAAALAKGEFEKKHGVIAYVMRY